MAGRASGWEDNAGGVQPQNEGDERTELNPWEQLSDDDLKKFLTDELNDENAPDRKFVINYLWWNFFEKIRLLDVGCGTGNQYLALKQAEFNFEYLGVDKTQKMVEFAQRRFPDAKFMQGDVHDLPFQDRSWQIVYARHLLVHLPGYEEALSELARVCDNYLIICLLNPLADKQQIKVVGKPPGQNKPGDFSEHYLNTYSRGPFMRMLGNLGFDVVVDERVKVGGFFKEYELIIARRLSDEERWQIEQDKAEQDRLAGETETRMREEEEARYHD